MLLEKKHELTRLVLSRKRKLSELYYATVSCGATEANRKNPHYLENESSFLAANDIEKSRLFDISTLPTRPSLIPPPQHKTFLQTIQNDPSTTGTYSHGLHPPSTCLPAAVPTKRLVSPSRRSRSPAFAGNDKQEQDERAETARRKGSPINQVSRGPGTGTEPSDSAANATKSSSPEKEINRTSTPTLRIDGDVVMGDGGSVRRGNSAERLSGSPSLRPSRTPVPREPSPLAQLSPRPADPNSSRASSEGAGSLNTLGATAPSPTTSPGEDHAQRAEVPTSKPDETMTDPDTSQPVAPQPIPRPLSDSAIMPPPSETVQAVRESIQTTKEATVSQRPTMRIDTQNTSQPLSHPKTTSGLPGSPMNFSGVIGHRRAPSASSVQSTPGRITRISSGTIRHKSVSEILGEVPKVATPSVERTHSHVISASPVEEPMSSISQASAVRGGREKDRSKLSTVVFAKPMLPEAVQRLAQGKGEARQDTPQERDYLHVLFQSKASSPPRGHSLNSLLATAHKTVSTTDHFIDYEEQMICRTLKRIYQLQNAGLWSLRQLARSAEPARPTSHWDFLLDHMKWMRTDFREERKWKMAAARGVAEWCAEWVASSPRRRKALQITRKRIVDKVEADHPDGMSSQPTPDLVPSAEDESVSDGYMDEAMDIETTAAPAAIFSLGPSEFIFPLEKTIATEKLLNELPFYQPALIEPDLAKSDLAERSDLKWKTDIVAVSRFAQEKIVYSPPKPPSRSSRYNYDEDGSARPPKTQAPVQGDVALFMDENQHIRDRIHPSSAFRPPNEYPMPQQSFFESRASSQWTQAEDDELRRLVKDYSYNWSLISACLSPITPFFAGADRRTPWECFERWISLEGLPADMSKTAYFRAYHSRIEAAGRHVLAQQEAAQRQAGANPLNSRKRTTLPIRVERKRSSKYLAMIDSMRKQAKKRETALQKQHHANELAELRKNQAQAQQTQEPDRPRTHPSTPGEFQRLKHERDVKAAERAKMYHIQMAAQKQVIFHDPESSQAVNLQQASMQQRTAQMNHANNLLGARGGGLPNGGLPGVPVQHNGMPVGHPQARQMVGMHGVPNGVPSNGGLSSNMLPKGFGPGQIQASLAAGRGLGNSPEQMRIFYEANRLQQQQALMLAQRQAQQQHQASAASTGQHSSPSLANAIVASNANNSPAFMAAVVASNGVPSPSPQMAQANGATNAGSPRIPNGHALSSGMTPAITQMAANIQRLNPAMSADEVTRVATSQLMSRQVQHQAQHVVSHQKSMNQAALNAAAGAANAGAHAANASAYNRPQGMMTNEQVQAYNVQLRQQQAAQRANGGYTTQGLGMNMNGNVGAVVGGMQGFPGGSPALSMSRPVSNHAVQGQMSRSATPREQRATSSGGMGMDSPRTGQGQGPMS